MRSVLKVDRGGLKTENVALERHDEDVGVGFGHRNLILKIDWAVRIYLKLLVIRVTQRTSTTHINHGGEKFVLF